MQATTLYLIRHGRTIENEKRIIQGHSYGTLSATGKLQAEDLAKRLETESFHHVFASDLKRVRQTLMPLLEKRKDLPVHFTELLRERSFGRYEGRFSDELNWKTIDLNERETDESLYDRALLFIRMLEEEHAAQKVLVAGHGGMLSALISALMLKGKMEYYTLSNAGVSIFKKIPGQKAKVFVFNDVSHLS